MKKFVKCFALAALVVPMVCSCSSKSDSKGGDSTVVSEEVVVESNSNLDIDMDRLTKIVDKKEISEVSSKEWDFLLDILADISKQTDGMTEEEYDKWMEDNLSSDDVGAIMAVSFAVESGVNKGVLSEKQMNRYLKLKEDSDKKRNQK